MLKAPQADEMAALYAEDFYEWSQRTADQLEKRANPCSFRQFARTPSINSE